MSWLVHRWFLLYGITLLVFKGCQSLFLRHTQSGKCIAAGSLIMDDGWGRRYWAEMVNNCLSDSARFSYLDTTLLHNIKTGGTLASKYGTEKYNNRLFIYDGKNQNGTNFENNDNHRLKQTAAGSLFLYDNSVNSCAQPNGIYVDQKKDGCSDAAEQKFTFGSVIQYSTNMKDVHCSPIQHMVVNRADYGDFNNGGAFDIDANIHTNCSIITNCLVKSFCGGKRSCELTIDNNLIPLQYCSDTSKEIYTEYNCVDSNNSSTITTAPKIRLSQTPNEGFIEIKHGSTWKKVEEEHWDTIRQKMLCQHLGFKETDANDINFGWFFFGVMIVTGDLICYNTHSSGTSCCVHLEPFTTKLFVSLPHVRCKICDNPILQDLTATFSGSGSQNYSRSLLNSLGWCASGSAPYLMLDLRKEYHVIRVVTMGNKDQTKWSESYSLKYSHDKTLVDGSRAVQISGNQNGYQASTTTLDIHNVRYIKIQSARSHDFCLRIELCGKVQTPAPVYGIKIIQSDYSAHVIWKLQTFDSVSSSITQIVIYLNGTKHKTISLRTQFDITGLKPYTAYTVGIQTVEGSSQKSRIVSENFKTNEAVPSGPPLNVTFTSRGKYSLNVSWKTPHENLWNGKLTGYLVCYSSRARANNPRCYGRITALSQTINNLQPSTKYFVTVSAATSVGGGSKSAEISKITNGEPANPVPTSSSGIKVTISKPATFIKEVMVIVQIVTSSQTPSEYIKTSELKPYTTNTQDPYVTAYLKPDVLPLTLVIGDGKVSNSEKVKCINQPLKQNSSYIVFLRFSESQDSDYSTEWSNSVKIMPKLTVEYFRDSETQEQPSEDKKTRMDLIIPLVFLVLCLLLSLAVIIYQRRRFQSNIRMAGHESQTLRQAHQAEQFGTDSILENLNRNKSMEVIQAAQRDLYVNDDAVYETPDDVIQCIERNKAESEPKISTRQESSTYMPLNDNKEPKSYYQSLQHPGTNADPHHTMEDDYQTMEYENPALNANFSGD